jgi:hypothetical protein
MYSIFYALNKIILYLQPLYFPEFGSGWLVGYWLVIMVGCVTQNRIIHRQYTEIQAVYACNRIEIIQTENTSVCVTQNK